jgi:hypothetical protein
MVSAIAIFAHLFVNEVIYLETIFENTIETTPTEQEEDEHYIQTHTQASTDEMNSRITMHA